MSEFAVRKLEEPQQSQVLQFNLAAPFINTEVKLHMTPFINHLLCLLKSHIDSNVQIPPGHVGVFLCPNTQTIMYCAVISWCRLTMRKITMDVSTFLFWLPTRTLSTQMFRAPKFNILKLMKCIVSVIKMSLGKKKKKHHCTKAGFHSRLFHPSLSCRLWGWAWKQLYLSHNDASITIILS